MDASIDAVRVAGTASGPVPVVLLSTDGGDDVLPIFVGFEEGRSIAMGMDAEDIGRPLTHDLTLDIVEELGGRVTRVVVRDLQDGTYLADLHLDTPRGAVTVDARPSDSLALAARTNASVEIDETVWKEGREPRDEYDELEDIREALA